MATTRQSSAPLFTTLEDIFASASYERDNDLILHKRGSNQFLGEDANHHDSVPTLGPRANRVQVGSLNLITNATSPIGPADAANPLGTGITPGGSNGRSED